jgi:hypothetical protein
MKLFTNSVIFDFILEDIQVLELNQQEKGFFGGLGQMFKSEWRYYLINSTYLTEKLTRQKYSSILLFFFLFFLSTLQILYNELLHMITIVSIEKAFLKVKWSYFVSHNSQPTPISIWMFI